MQDTQTIWRDGKEYFIQWTTDNKDGDRLDYIALTETCNSKDPDNCEEPHETFDFYEIHQHVRDNIPQ